MARVVLAMSGGVDSSVSAHLLQQAGHEVIGLFMKHGEDSAVCATSPAKEANGGRSPLTLPIVQERLDHKQGCCSASDAADARRVADRLDIPFYAINFEREFGRIMDYFVHEYTRARTPNPCVMCNNWLKFGKLFDYADNVNAEFVATGHYARLLHMPEPALFRGVDLTKDQSYALFGIQRDYLPRIMLPVGDMDKVTIREIARSLGLRVAEKKDSQEICFVTSGHHAEFVRQRGGNISTAGRIETVDGKYLGEHDGIEAFTIGQRKGVGVAMGIPYYVVRIDALTHTVVIGPKEALERTTLTASQANWLTDLPGERFACLAKIRYNSMPVPAEAHWIDSGRFSVEFNEPRHGVSPGQAVVLFDGDRVLGGGWID